MSIYLSKSVLYYVNMARRIGTNVYKDLVLPRLDEIKVWIFNGVSLVDIAHNLDISISKLLEMRKDSKCIELQRVFAYEDFAVEAVERSLYKKCIGEVVRLNKQVKLKKEFYDDNGKKCTEEELVDSYEEIYVPAEFPAQRFFLINRKPSKWHSENAGDMSEDMERLLGSGDKIAIKIKQLATDAKVDEDK